MTRYVSTSDIQNSALFVTSLVGTHCVSFCTNLNFWIREIERHVLNMTPAEHPREEEEEKLAAPAFLLSECTWRQTAVERSLTLRHLSPPLSFYPSFSSLLFCISMPIPNAHAVCHPPTYNHSLLLTFHTLYTQCDTSCLSSLYNIHIYIAFTIIYWHCSYKTIISCLATYSSMPNSASHQCLQPSLSCEPPPHAGFFYVGLFLLICTPELCDIRKCKKMRGCVGWVGQETCQNDQ